MAPKRMLPTNESPTASSPSREQDNEPSSTIPPFPSLSSTDSDSEQRWIMKPHKPIRNAKRVKKTSDHTMDASVDDKSCEILPSLSEDVSRREEFDKRRIEMQVVELDFEIYIRCVQIIAAQAKLICDAYNSSKER